MSFLKQKEKIEGIEKLTTVFLGHAVPPVLYFIWLRIYLWLIWRLTVILEKGC